MPEEPIFEQNAAEQEDPPVGKKKQIPHRRSPKAGDRVRDDNVTRESRRRV